METKIPEYNSVIVKRRGKSVVIVKDKDSIGKYGERVIVLR